MRHIRAALSGLVFCLGAATTVAEPVTLKFVLSPKNSISLGFKDNDRHFVTLVEREGTVDGNGGFDGAKAFEYGFHDVTHGESGEAIGYFVATTTEGDSAYFRWRLRAFFVAGAEGKTKVINSGHWEITAGTGKFENVRGVGALRLEFLNKTDRRFVLEGDISPKP